MVTEGEGETVIVQQHKLCEQMVRGAVEERQSAHSDTAQAEALTATH